MASIQDARAITAELVTHIQQNMWDHTDITPSEVIKGGSLGHGTAVPERFDLDLIIYTRDITEDDIEEENYSFEKWIKLLHRFLRSSLKGRYQHTTSTAFSVQFKFDGIIDVDLLISPYWESPEDFYEFLSQVPLEDRHRLTVCTAKWQVELFKREVDSRAKMFIKRAKAWRNKQWKRHPGRGGKPKSYLISVLVYYAYEEVYDEELDDEELAKSVEDELIKLVENHESIDIVWDDIIEEPFYERKEYPSLNCSRPRVMDPVNPANNLYFSGLGPSDPGNKYGPGDGKWEWLVANIRSLDLSRDV